MAERVYKVGDIRALIAESSTNEFKPVLGTNVERDDKANNGKAYKDAEKRAKDYDGGLAKEEDKQLPKKEDFNRTTLDYNPRTEPDKAWKDKVEAQAKGFTSKAEEENGIEKAAEFDKDGKILKQFKDSNALIQGERNDLATSGLVSREMDKKGAIQKKPTMMESATPKAKRLVFKHTQFLSESKMLQLIPEEYKKDGQKIYMQDSHNNEYIVECVKSKETGYLETNVISHSNKQVMNEQMNRIQQLFDYNTKSTSGRNIKTSSARMDEQADIRKMIDKMKQK